LDKQHVADGGPWAYVCVCVTYYDVAQTTYL
jgi:hypothetical protein